MDLKCITAKPLASHTHTVVFLHGRGDTAGNFSASLTGSRDSHNRTLFEIFPSFRWVFPQSEMRPCASDYGDLRSQWFDVWSLEDFTQQDELQARGLRESVVSIRKILVKEIELLDGRSENVILMGISQGAATCVHVLLNLNLKSVGTKGEGEPEALPRLGGFIGFAGWMPFVARSLEETRGVLGLEDVPEGDEVLRNTPVLLEYCVDDEVVRIENGIAMRKTLRDLGVGVEWREYESGGHWFKAPEGIEDAVAFIKDRVPDVPERKDGAFSQAQDVPEA